jgi:ABC-2 type transport system permease protein
MRGSVAALVPLFVLHFIAVIGLSLFLSSYFKSKLTALVVFITSSYPLFLASGYSWPLSAMTPPMRLAVSLLPSTHFFAAYTRIANMGATVVQVLPELALLAGMAATGMGLAVWRLRQLQRQTPTSDTLAVVRVQ